ncbi:hypothetical protein F4859DRAFT_526150 [Xylaria cf. heliscus]|nr:hypothetical protein F4859DRAFT_526150 [Xylaria cf. heliscus]
MAHCLESGSSHGQASLLSNDVPEPFSLLSGTTRKALQDRTSKDVIYDANVVDMFPCTSFQKGAVLQGLKKQKSFYAWFLMRIKGTVDLKRLLTACAQLVQRQATLRTTFLVIDNCFVQQIHHYTDALTDFKRPENCNSEVAFIRLLDRDISEPVRLGHLLTRFRVSFCSEGGNGGCILGMGMSHAQYDGFCWTKIFDDLRQAYISQSLDADSRPPPPLSRFISHVIKTSVGPDMSIFWATLLKDAMMTYFTTGTEQHQPMLVLDSRYIRKMPLYNVRLGNVTFAVVVKAAWSIVLSWLSASDDVVFGCLVFGRNPEIAGIGEMTGACLNVVPNRVSFSSMGSLTVIDFLRQIQQQQTAIVPYESTSLPEVSQIMDWPAGTRFGSVVQHQNIEDGAFTDINLHSSNQGECETTWSFEGSASYPALCDDVVDCWITTVPRPDEIQLQIHYNAERIPDECASRLATLLCDVIDSIYADESRTLSSIRRPHESISVMMTQLRREKSNNKGKSIIGETAASRMHNARGRLERDSEDVLRSLQELWMGVLTGPLTPERVNDNDDASFFDLGGDSIRAIQLAQACQRRGLDLHVRDIFTYPTRRLQAAHLQDNNGRMKAEEGIHLVFDPK